MHKAKLAIVTGIEGFDDLTPELAAKFNVVPAVRPSYRIFELPDVVIEALGALPGPQIIDGCVGEIEGEKSVETRRVTIADSNGIAELSDTGSPAIPAIQRNMAPTNAGVIDEAGADQARPIAYGVVNRRS